MFKNAIVMPTVGHYHFYNYHFYESNSLNLMLKEVIF